MRESELVPGTLVVANGALAKVVECLTGLRIKVLVSNSQSLNVIPLSEIEIIPTSDLLPDSSKRVGASVRDEVEDLAEIELAQRRFYALTKYKSGTATRAETRIVLAASNGLFYKLLRAYDANTGYESLLRMTRGRKAGVHGLAPDIEKIIKESIFRKYEGRGASTAHVWRDIEATCLKLGKGCPSMSTVRRRLMKIDPRELHRRKYGAESARQNFESRPMKKTTKAPLEFVQMDHTLVDVILVDEKDRKPLGRPWLTMIIDKHTKVILGYYLSFNAPSTVSVACAISHAVLPKFKFLERLGLPITTHPYFGLFKTIHMDNAKEFRSAKFQRACIRNGIEPTWRPYGRKHYGGDIERLIGTFMTSHVHFLPGTTMSNTQQRKGTNSEQSSALTFKEFSRWFAGEVAIYHGRKHSSLGRSPGAAWDAYFTNAHGQTKYPPIIVNQFTFRLDFMPEVTRKVQSRGIVLFGNIYWSPALQPYVGRGNVAVKYDPCAVKTIWARLNDEYVPLIFSDVTKGDFSIEERKVSHQLRVSKAGALEDFSLVEVIDRNEHLVNKSVKDTKAARRKKAGTEEYLENYSEDLSAISKTQIKSEKIVHRPNYAKKADPFKGRDK